ncbi:MAG: hypothetical protein ACPGTG_07565 [Flavobacteriales bacterium]
MKFILFISVFIFSNSLLFAQKKSFSFDFSLNHSFINNKNINLQNYDFNRPLSPGLALSGRYNQDLNEKLNLSYGLSYTFVGHYLQIGDINFFGFGEFQAVGLPIHLKYRLNDSFNFGMGTEPSYYFTEGTGVLYQYDHLFFEYNSFRAELVSEKTLVVPLVLSVEYQFYTAKNTRRSFALAYKKSFQNIEHVRIKELDINGESTSFSSFNFNGTHLALIYTFYFGN